ncbi:hypothetical protein H4R20_000173 [Coemansia guatemalensis]|uniref:PAS domain-containing protein n=1 Tax=Coemansia guatemalensis TaxID=2761395 RepID=A0A9W8HZR4_9FUNG|nr:hypothetical protein H4R20_000173 [Coemansia guatemalensis]
MNILYVSSSVRYGMGYEPQEVVDGTVETFLSNANAREYKNLATRNDPREVVIAGLFVRAASGMLRFMRLIHFNCDDIAMNVAVIFPDPVPEQQESTPLDVSVYNPNVADTNIEENSRNEEPRYQMNHPESPLEMRLAANTTRLLRNPPQNFTHYARTCTKACLILEGALRREPMVDFTGPKVLFASKSFSRIIDIDASDVQGLPFLSLVATEDIVRAASFLEKLATPERIVLENINFLANPLSDVDNAARQSNNVSQATESVGRTVTVEVLGAGSDDGAIIIFQLNQSQSSYSRNVPDSDGYMSLEDIISSDPDTSDVPDAWRSASIDSILSR